MSEPYPNPASEIPSLGYLESDPAIQLIGTRILGCAETHGIVLSPQRLDKLVASAVYETDDRRAMPAFSQDGLRIAFPTLTPSGVRAARADFTPATAESPTGTIIPTPGEATNVVLTGLRALQNYVMLIELGYVDDPPEILMGLTNSAMARLLVGRLGATERKGESDYSSVRLSLAEVSKRVFDPSLLRLQERLSARQESQGIIPHNASDPRHGVDIRS
ncbi:MAG TPA: hypothetical protein VLH38_02335 [Patescibacteria group bacterium]|nr:hypothetical protein [Patescibacteria group bacterium]